MALEYLTAAKADRAGQEKKEPSRALRGATASQARVRFKHTTTYMKMSNNKATYAETVRSTSFAKPAIPGIRGLPELTGLDGQIQRKRLMEASHSTPPGPLAAGKAEARAVSDALVAWH
eukprot:TRINITY_DN11533_c0_g1_i4.p1 TRINITY_DN11533_c0_g1~~TRINITY_DN11533_c0_g1_i4.p1  ORF type:complete len:119 (+),score=16.92 TRINITY_DN11533_c0_g1_i4:73-429(+)